MEPLTRYIGILHKTHFYVAGPRDKDTEGTEKTEPFAKNFLDGWRSRHGHIRLRRGDWRFSRRAAKPLSLSFP